jgi:uncharacterized membrane protein YadS
MSKNIITQIGKVLPGLALCGLVTLTAFGLESLERQLFGRAWLESLVLAILRGSFLRTSVCLSAKFDAGVHFGAKMWSR